MKYVEKYNCFVDDDCVIYAYGTGKKHSSGKLYRPRISISASGYLYVPLDKRMVSVHRVIAEALIPNDDPVLYRHNKYMANREAFILAAREYRRKRCEYK